MGWCMRMSCQSKRQIPYDLFLPMR